jgi:hypothetical protein
MQINSQIGRWAVLSVAILALSACGSGEGSGEGDGGNGGGGKISGKVSAKLAGNFSNNPSTKVIYGDDNRLDLYDVKDAKRLKLADSTVALISAQSIHIDGVMAKIDSVPYVNERGAPLCPSERFRDQDSGAFCSGFLIAPNVIATAGHCVTNDQGPNNDCAQTKFVFGYSLNYPGASVHSVPATEVYSCKRIIKREQNMQGQDYAVVEIDRNVPNHEPLKLRQSGDPALSDELMVIGHPSGLPTKVADGASIRFVRTDYLRASLDTYGGNSGSAVFNTRTNEVEGILVRGEQDFVYQDSCLVSKKCAQNECRGEDVTRVSYVVPYSH